MIPPPHFKFRKFATIYALLCGFDVVFGWYRLAYKYVYPYNKRPRIKLVLLTVRENSQ